MRRSTPCIAAIALTTAVCVACRVVEDDAIPNIVTLFLDDAGYGDFGYTGNPVIRTLLPRRPRRTIAPQ